jgi:hypothetical protein
MEYLLLIKELFVDRTWCTRESCRLPGADELPTPTPESGLKVKRNKNLLHPLSASFFMHSIQFHQFQEPKFIPDHTHNDEVTSPGGSYNHSREISYPLKPGETRQGTPLRVSCDLRSIIENPGGLC